MRNMETLIPHWDPTDSCSGIRRPNFFSGLLVVYNFLIHVARIEISVSLFFFLPPLEEASAVHDSNR